MIWPIQNYAKKTEKITETLANGYLSESTQRGLTNEYQHDRVKMVFKILCILVLQEKVASALEGLTFLHNENPLMGLAAVNTCFTFVFQLWWFALIDINQSEEQQFWISSRSFHFISPRLAVAPQDLVNRYESSALASAQLRRVKISFQFIEIIISLP